MKIEKDDLITVKGEDYITLDVIVQNNSKYALVNKIVDEEPTQYFYVFEILDEGIKRIHDESKLNVLLPMFSNNVQKMVDEYRKNENI